MGIEVVTERVVPQTPELQYFRENREEIRSFEKSQRHTTGEAADTGDFYLSRKKPLRGARVIRLWPKPKAARS